MTRHIHIPAPSEGESATTAVTAVLNALRRDENRDDILDDRRTALTLDPPLPLSVAACIEFVDGLILRNNTAALPDGTPAPEPFLWTNSVDIRTS